MAGIAVLLAVAASLVAGLLSPIAQTSQPQQLAESDRTDIDRAVLRYSFTRPSSKSGSDFDFYIALQGRIPTQQFLDEIGGTGGKLKPWNLAADVDPKQNFIGSGHNVMRVMIGGISFIETNKVHLDVTSKCGPVLCGTGETFVLQKTDGKWAVVSVKRNYNE